MNLSLRLEKPLKKLLKPGFIALISSFLAGFLLLMSAFLSYKNTEKTLDTNLKLQALSLEVVLQSLFKTFDINLLKERKDFFSELLLNERWEGVAFITLYDTNKTIVLHSNPDLIGQKVEKSFLLEEKRQTSFFTLKTGETVYLYENYVINKQNPLILRIALHVGPVMESLNFARRHFYIDFSLSLLLFTGGLGAFFILSRIERSLSRMEELERWQFITRVLLHEIKNPLASIKGFAQYLQRKCVEKPAEKPLTIILKETLRIENLLKELSHFTFSREPELKIIDLKELLEEVVESLKFLYEEVQIEITPEGENFKTKSDPEKLRSIFLNLMENALHASFEAGKEKIFVGLKEKGEYYIIKIRDEGLGIDEKILPYIFEPFFTTKSRGTGLGLAIVKKFCEELGLDLKIESEKGKGTRACLKIPRSL
ncbi:sensor histidine kinase [Caldimicrobium thiodismutans]|uniref:sensor histidine kinase n=1 Tax=Caldimicrobium thiodismutans TaxID=1653476 RepID=UPI0009E87E8D|nr:HAMP domain-containing sensor histidine kinase [Caldimicrobium thiodismutans]